MPCAAIWRDCAPDFFKSLLTYRLVGVSEGGGPGWANGMEVMMQTGLSQRPGEVASAVAHLETDEQLLGQIAAGDRHALELLYRRHHVRVYRFLVRLTDNAASAEDLTSDVFLEIWKDAERFQGRSRVSTWMLGIAR